MKKIILFLLMLLPFVSAFAAKPVNLDEMSADKRNKYLLSESKKIIMRYGPDFYRDVKPPTITRAIVGIYGIGGIGFSEKFENTYMNRPYYYIKYQYDDTQESFFARDIAAIVCFWADTGKAFDLLLGSGQVVDLEDPITGTSKDKRFYKHTKQPPRKKMKWEK